MSPRLYKVLDETDLLHASHGKQVSSGPDDEEHLFLCLVVESCQILRCEASKVDIVLAQGGKQGGDPMRRKAHLTAWGVYCFGL